MQWYYVQNGARVGPITQEQFDQLARTGVIAADTLIWRAGMSAWMPFSQAFAQPELTTAPGPDYAVCAVSGKVGLKRDMLEYNGQWISAEHKDEFFQRLREGILQRGEMRYAGFWIRFVAVIIDSLCLLALLIIPFMIFWSLFKDLLVPTFDPVTQRLTSHFDYGMLRLLQLGQFVVQTTIALAFDLLFIRKYDATPGKLALGLKIVRSNGGKLTIGRIIGRFFAKWVSQIIIYIGYMIAAWTDQKCALHDYICDTRVIKK